MKTVMTWVSGIGVVAALVGLICSGVVLAQKQWLAGSALALVNLVCFALNCRYWRYWRGQV